jgi:LmbE family N-acetylglucosaminyl deacetylase
MSSQILLVVAHPDDETIGAGALLSRQNSAEIVYVTEGAPKRMTDALAAGFSTQDAYASARIAEAKNALRLAGIPPASIRNMRYTDQQVAFRLKDLAQDLLHILEQHAPETMLTHAYEGGHPDHDSVAFACHLALKLYCAGGNRPAPQFLEFAAYHGEGGRMKTYEFLPWDGVAEQRHQLTPAEQSLKTQMLHAFSTQTRTLRPFLPPLVEVYRRAPAYDFTRAPHSGKLFYEQFDWGIDGASWRNLAREARNDLNLQSQCL